MTDSDGGAPRAQQREVQRPFLGKVTLTYTLATITQSLAAFVLTALLASFFGASSMSDTYYVAYWIPAAIITISGEVAFVTIFSSLQRLRASYPQRVPTIVARRYLIVGGWLCLALMGVGMALAPVAVWALGVPSGGEYALTLRVAVAYGPYIALSILTTLVGAVVASLFGHIRNAAVLPISTLFIAAASGGLLAAGCGIYSFPFGAAIGQAVALVVVLLRRDVRHLLRRPERPLSARSDSDAAKARAEWGAAYGATIACLVPFIVIGLERALATRIGSGSASILAYGRTLLILPGLIAAPVGTALMGKLPFVREEDRGAMMWRSLSYSFVFSLIAAVALGVGGQAILRLAFGRGQFDVLAVSRTQVVLLLMLTGLIGYSIYPLLLRVLQAELLAAVMIGCALSTVASYASLALVFDGILGERGLALAFGISNIPPSVIALVAMVRRFGLPPRGVWLAGSVQLGLAVTFIAIGWRLGSLSATASFGRVAGTTATLVVLFAGCACLAPGSPIRGDVPIIFRKVALSRLGQRR